MVEMEFDENALKMPKRAVKVFLGDMTNLFADFVPDGILDRIFASVVQHPHNIYQVLTKRPERQRSYFCRQPPPSNLWVGTSIEQRRYLNRLATLYATPAAIRFASLALSVI
jgi:protein gp37